MIDHDTGARSVAATRRQPAVRPDLAVPLPTWQDLTPSLLRVLYIDREWSMRQIAVLYGFAETSIRRRLLRAGVAIRPRSAKGGAPRAFVDLTQVVAGLRAGLSLEDVAEAQAVSVQTIRRNLAEAGLIPARRSRYDRGEANGTISAVAR